MKPSAAERLAARAERVRRVRRRVIATAVTTFVVAWTVIFGQLVSGHDPALAHAHATTQSTSAAGNSAPSAATSSPATAPSPVTTSQS